MRSLALLEDEITRCRACPRLVRWREDVARVKRRKYVGDVYWGRPVPGFGDPRARIVILGLAPGAHGANRTGRIFTGDRSGDFLFAALHRAGLANRPQSVWRDDGLELEDVFITATLRCVPPANKPAPDEIARCARFLDGEIALLRHRRVVLALGAIAWAAWRAHLARHAHLLPRPLPRFAHGAELPCSGDATLLASYHVSQQNTQTGKLTPWMFDRILARAKALAKL